MPSCKNKNKKYEDSNKDSEYEFAQRQSEISVHNVCVETFASQSRLHLSEMSSLSVSVLKMILLWLSLCVPWGQTLWASYVLVPLFPSERAQFSCYFFHFHSMSGPAVFDFYMQKSFIIKARTVKHLQCKSTWKAVRDWWKKRYRQIPRGWSVQNTPDLTAGAGCCLRLERV